MFLSFWMTLFLRRRSIHVSKATTARTVSFPTPSDRRRAYGSFTPQNNPSVVRIEPVITSSWNKQKTYSKLGIVGVDIYEAVLKKQNTHWEVKRGWSPPDVTTVGAVRPCTSVLPPLPPPFSPLTLPSNHNPHPTPPSVPWRRKKTYYDM